MPEVHFRIRWPDQSETRCYSPSTTIMQFLTAGRSYPLNEFLTLSRQALEHGSERVRQKYGYGCGHAQLQIAEIERVAIRFADSPAACVSVVNFEI
ncbi:MAG TPA: MSMEG_0570 family nitrogen starvation response protein [Steroidobacteraceae bacterium]|jgi:uncharacterized repeat protein (TIGR04042 family)|nr:MSMEG_0570 family nitrogen starvation response protein [Steroidobacteraceae bacterium]